MKVQHFNIMNGVEETLFDFVSKSKFQKLSLKMSFARSPGLDVFWSLKTLKKANLLVALFLFVDNLSLINVF